MSIKVDELENGVISLLKKYTPKEQSLNMFITFMFKIYHERLARVTKLRNEADLEIDRLKSLRQTLVQKNLAGVYSDEVFKEQNTLIEDQIMQAQIAKDDGTIDKYNIEAVTTFIRTLLADLGETYKRSSLSQNKVLLGSMFPSGLAWSNNGTLNHEISPIYSAIQSFSEMGVSTCAQERT